MYINLFFLNIRLTISAFKSGLYLSAISNIPMTGRWSEGGGHMPRTVLANAPITRNFFVVDCALYVMELVSIQSNVRLGYSKIKIK